MKFIRQNNFFKFSVLAYLFFSLTAYATNDISEHDPQQTTMNLVVFIPPLTNPVEEFLESQRRMIDGKSLTVEGVLLFDGHGLISQLVKYCTWKEYSHVGILLRANTGERFCFELYDTLTVQKSQGIFAQVQITPLSSVINNYNGRIVKRDIIHMQGTGPDASEFVHKYLGTPLERRPIELLKTLVRFNKEADFTTFLCSSLVVLLFQDLGYLLSNPSANSYHPGDFAQSTKWMKLQNATLEDEITLK